MEFLDQALEILEFRTVIICVHLSGWWDWSSSIFDLGTDTESHDCTTRSSRSCTIDISEMDTKRGKIVMSLSANSVMIIIAILLTSM